MARVQRQSELTMDNERRSELKLLQKILNVRFSDLSLLNRALVHRSYANEVGIKGNNERLEFLGDSVLGLVVTDHLFHVRAGDDEGYLAKCKSYIVSEDSLARISRVLTIENYLLVGRGEELSGGRLKKAILSDMLEAIIGAYYLDAGFEKCAVFILAIVEHEIERVLADEHDKDYKSLLQEFVQQRYKTYPNYKVRRRDGPEHNWVFWVEVIVNKQVFGPASGTNIKSAEKEAAKLAFEKLSKNKK